MSELERTQEWPTPLREPAAENGDKPDEIGADSVLGAIRARRQQLEAEETLLFEVPGYRGLLALEMGPISPQQTARIRTRHEKSKSPERDFNLNCDTVITATRQVFGRARPADPWRVLDPSGEPVRIDGRLGELLEFDNPLESSSDARSVLRWLFRYAHSAEFAINRCAGEYTEWASSAGDDIEEELLGES